MQPALSGYSAGKRQTYPRHVTHFRNTDDSTQPDHDDAILECELKLAERGVELVKMEGRVFLRFDGEVRYQGLRVPYRLVPERGVLAKPSKWRKMDLDARRQLIEDRANPDAIEQLQGHAEDFVRDI
jgi:ATP-dependent RNA helicase SUPV3L1/SUV3